MKKIQVSKSLQKMTGWLSVSADYEKIIARGKTLKELIEQLKKKGNPDGLIIHSPPQKFSSYVGVHEKD